MSRTRSQQTKQNPKDSSDTVELSAASSLPEFTAFIQQLDVSSYDKRKSLTRIKDSGVFESTLQSLSDDDWKDCLQFMQCCLRKDHQDVSIFATSILKYKSFLDWKGHPELLENLLATFIDITRDRSSLNDVYSDFVEILMKIIRQNNLFKDHATVIIALIQPTISDVNYKFYSFLHKMAEGFPWQNHRELTQGILQDICNQLEELLKGTMPSKSSKVLGPRLRDMLEYIIKTMSSAENILPWITKIYNLCLKADRNSIAGINKDKAAICYKILRSVMRDYFRKHQKQSPQLCQSILKSLFELVEGEDEDLQEYAVNILDEVAATPEIVQEEHVEDFIRLNEMNDSRNHYPCDLVPLFKRFPDIFCPKADEFVNRMVQDMDSGNQRYQRTLQLMWEMAKKRPQAFSTRSIKELVKMLRNSDVQYITLYTLQSLSETRQEDILPYQENIVSLMKKEDSMAYAGATILGHLAITESHARENLKVIFQFIECTSSQMKPSLISTLRSIGVRYPNVLGEFRDVLEELGKETAMADHIRHVLDLIEGRSLADVSRMIDQQKGVMNDLENRVACVEHDLDTLTNHIEGASGEISDKERPPRPPRPTQTTSECAGCSALQDKLLSCQTAQQKLLQDMEARDKEVQQLIGCIQQIDEDTKSRQKTMENQWARLWQKMNSELTKVKQQLQEQGEKIEESWKAEAESRKAEAESRDAEAESRRADPESVEVYL